MKSRLSMTCMIVVLVLLATGSLAAQEYTPLTPAEARAYWQSLSPEELDIEIMHLDQLENSPLELSGFAVRAWIIENDVHVDIVAEDGSETILAGVGYLEYGLKFEPQVVRDVVPEQSGVSWPVAITAVVVSILGGMVGGLMIGR